MSKINYKETILVIEDIDTQSSVVHKRFKTLGSYTDDLNRKDKQNQRKK